MPSDSWLASPVAQALRVVAWLLLAFIAFSTLAPIELRPESGLPADVERAVAYALFGLALGLAYPRRLVLTVSVLVVSALGLELLQAIDPTRHGRLADALVKLAGGAVGLAFGMVVVRMLMRRQQAIEASTSSNRKT